MKYPLMTLLTVAGAIAAVGSNGALTAMAAQSCESLPSLMLPNATITLAQAVAAGAFTPPAAPGGATPSPAAAQAFHQLPAFCRVAATLTPSSDSDIKVEVWMPTSGWNGKFLGIGNGGWAGTISYLGAALVPGRPLGGALAGALSRGYAAASTDTGHVGTATDGSFAFDHPEKLVDFAYRAVHDMTVHAKAIVSAYYGRAPRVSYWAGCSTGGRQALKEAQRYPADYDGIIAGAPANYWTHLMTHILWVAQAVRQDSASAIPESKYRVINDAVMAQCDAQDGVKDGVLEDPRTCGFNPAVLQCQGADDANCLTAPQVAALKKVYGSVLNPRTGTEIYPGLSVGSELGWAPLPQPFGIAESHYKYVVFGDPKWDFRSLDFDKHLEKAESLDADGAQITANDPDLMAFKARGGKLIQYHGWNDQQISAQNSINYYTRVVARTGSASQTEDFYRLFMVPGMNHCAGGQGPDSFDSISALEQWVEQGKAPGRIIASRAVGGHIERTRPLCPYPQVALYKGTGSTDDAENFVCKTR